MYQPYQSTWNNPYLQQYQNPMQNYMQPVNGIVKVNGPQSAMQCQLPPNSTSQPMFDTNTMCFYVVSTDGTGTKSLEWFDFSPHVEQQQENNTTQYVTRSEFDERIEKLYKAMGVENGTNAAVASNE